MTEDNKNTEKQCDIYVVMCSSCKNEIKQEDEKHAFWEEDVNEGIPLKCLDCHLETESICRDFGF